MKRQTNSNTETSFDNVSESSDIVSSVASDSSFDTSTIVSDYDARMLAARLKAEQLISNRQYAEAKIALAEVDRLQAIASRIPEAEAARAKAAQLLAEQRYPEAIKALEHAEGLEAPPGKAERWSKDAVTGIRTHMTGLREKLQKTLKRSPKTDKGAVEEPVAASTLGSSTTGVGAVDGSLRIVKLYSKIAAAVGLLPGGLLNFAAVLAVQVVMVWRIARTFGHNESKGSIRGAVLSLVSSALPSVVGHGAGAAIASIPAAIVGTAVYFVAAPVIAYAMTEAVGKVFIMHFESGNTLLTFDPKAFGENFLNEFKSAGGKVETLNPEPVPAV